MLLLKYLYTNPVLVPNRRHHPWHLPEGALVLRPGRWHVESTGRHDGAPWPALHVHCGRQTLCHGRKSFPRLQRLWRRAGLRILQPWHRPVDGGVTNASGPERRRCDCVQWTDLCGGRIFLEQQMHGRHRAAIWSRQGRVGQGVQRAGASGGDPCLHNDSSSARGVSRWGSDTRLPTSHS